MSATDLPAALPQQPMQPQEPAPDVTLAKSRLMRLLKLRSDQLQVPKLFDNGQVAIEAISDPKEAAATARRAFVGYATVNTDMRGQIRDYLTGKRPDYPDGWDLGDAFVPSRETVEAESMIRQAKEGRKRNPLAAAALDYAVNPIQRLVTGTAQIPVNIGAAVMNVMGAKITPWDVRSETTAIMGQLTGSNQADAATIRRQQQAMDETGALPARVLGTAADIKGMIAGLSGKVAGAAMAPGAGIAGGLVKMGGAGKGVEGLARAAGGFAGYEALTKRGVDPETGESRTPTAEERIGAAGSGAVMGTVMHGAGQIASAALRGIFKTPAKNLDPVGRDLVTALKDFGIKAKILPVKGQTQEAYGERLLDGWIKARMPGAPMMPFRKLFGYAVKGGIEGAGLLHLDAQFREDLYGTALEPGVLQGNFENLDRVIEKFAGTALGLAAFSRPLKDIPRMQRGIPTPGTQRPETPQQPGGKTEGPLNRAQQEALDSLFWHHKFEHERQPGGRGPGTIDSAQPTREGNRFDTVPQEPGAAPQDRPRSPEMEAAEARGERIIGERYTEAVEGPGRREIEAQWENLLGADVIRLGWRPVKEIEIPNELQSLQSPLERAGYDIVSNELGKVKIRHRETNATRELTEQEFYGEFGRQQPEPGEPRPESIDYTKDDTRREFLAQQSREFPEGIATVEVGGNAARQALSLVGQSTPLGKQLAAIAEAGGGQLSVSAKEARKLIAYHTRSAPRMRARGEEGVEQSRIQAIDSLAEKLVEAFGLGKEPPRGEKRTGPEAPGGPGEPLGEPYRPEVSGEPTRREPPPEGGGDVEVPPKGKKPKGGPGEAKREPATEMELPGTDHTYTIEDGQGWASPKLEDLLGIETPMPAREFSDLLRRAQLLSAMDSRILLPGTLVSADGTVAEAGQGDAPGVMRTIRMGEVLQAPLSPDPKWGPAEEFPARGQDALHPIQEAAVEALKGVLNGRPDLSQADTVMLSKVIETMDTVSAKNDQAVAETLQVLPDALQGMAHGSPEHAGKVIVAVAEMLTTKTPDVVMDDMQAAQEPRPDEMVTIYRAQEKRGEKRRPEWLEQNPDVQASDEATGKWWTDQREEAQWYLDKGMVEGNIIEARVPRSVVEASRVSNLPESHPARRFSRRPERELFLEQPPRSQGEEAGFIDVGGALEAGKRFLDLMRTMPAKALGHALSPFLDNPATKWGITGLSEKLRDKLGATHPKIVESVFAIEGGTRRNDAQWAPLMREIMATAGKRLPELDTMRWTEATDSGWEPGFREDQVMKETDLQELFNTDRAVVSDEARAALKAHDAATYAIREKAHDLGVKITNAEGEQVLVSREATKDVATRQLTPLVRDALLRREGRLYNGVIDSIAKVNKMTRERVEEIFAEEGYTEARTMKRRDPIETMRRFRYMPDHMRDAANGEVVKIMETNLLRHGKAMLDLAAKRLGVYEELGPDEPPPEGQTAEQAFADGLPVPYLSIVNSVKSPADRQLVATALRALHGMATVRPSQIVEVGSGWHKTLEVAQSLNSLAAASKMTLGSPIQNIGEPWATASALLGRDRMGAAADYVHGMLKARRFTDLLKEREAAGGFALHVTDWLGIAGEQGKLEKFKAIAKTAQQGFLVPFEITQAITDAKVHKAWHDAVDGWREGRREANDVAALKTLFRFSDVQAQQIVSGEAPAKAYDNIAVNGLVRITRRGDQPINKSGFGSSRLGRWVHFTNFFQRQTENMRSAVVAMRDAKTPEEASSAATNFGRLMGFNLGTYVAGQAIMKFLTGQWDELQGFFGETLEDLSTPGGVAKFAGAALVGSFFGSVGSFVAGGAYSYLTGDEKGLAQLAETTARMVPGVGSTIATAQFVHAFGTTMGGGNLGAGSDYAGKSPLQQIGYFIAHEVPLAKWAMNGPLGVGMTYLGTDPDLELALKASRRFDAKRDIGEDFPDNPDAAFVDTMRAAINKLKAEDGGSHGAEIADAIRQALPDKDDSAIASSFEARRQLTGKNWTQLSEEQQAAKLRSLGQKRVELLRGYDAVLEMAASYFRPSSRRRRRR